MRLRAEFRANGSSANAASRPIAQIVVAPVESNTLNFRGCAGVAILK